MKKEKSMKILTLTLALAASGVWANDLPVSESQPLTADTTVDALTVDSGATLDLASYSLTCSSLAGSGTITSTSSPDLTTFSGTVTWSTNSGTAQTASGGSGGNLFNDADLSADTNDNDSRILVAKANLPLAVTYDFGEGTPRKVSKYRMFMTRKKNYFARGPKTWTFEGSNDNQEWKNLDSQDDVAWTAYDATTNPYKEFLFANDKAYRYYRITFTASSDNSYLELNQLEYFNTNPGELHVNVGEGETVNSSISISGNTKIVKDGSGTLSGITQIASDASATVGLVVEDGRVTVDDATLYVGHKGSGTLTIKGGTVDVSSSDCNVNLAQNSGSSGTINLNGGTLKTRRVVKANNGISGTLNFNGGTLQANPTSNNNLSGGLIASSVTTTVNDGGGTIHSGNLEIKVGAAISGKGAMRFKGGSAITLEGENSYTGGTTIELGTKVVTSDATTKGTILGGLTIDGSAYPSDATGIVVFQYGSALEEGDLANVSLENCGTGTEKYIDGDSIKVNFVAPSWALDANANWSDLVATYGTPAAGETVRIAASEKYTFTIDQDISVGQIVFMGTNPNVVVDSGCTVTADTINFSADNTDYYVLNNGVIVLNGNGVTSLRFHNDSRGVYYVNAGTLQSAGQPEQGSTTPGLLPEGTNQFVCVASGATYDINGMANNTMSVRLAVGATIANLSSTSIGSGTKQIPQLILDGNATANIQRSFGLVGTGHSETRLDLGEHNLTITGGGTTGTIYSFFMNNTTVSGTGKIVVENGKLFAVENAGGEKFTLEIGSSGQLVLDRVNANRSYTDFTVGNFVNNGTDSSATDAGALVVKGMLTPGKAIKKLTLADGAKVKATGTVQEVTGAFSASGVATIDVSAITKAQLDEATDERIAVLTVPTADKGGTWVVDNAPYNGCRAKWGDNGDDTSTLYLAKPTGLMIIFR